MNKCVLLTVSVLLALLPITSEADFYNNSLLKEKSQGSLRHRYIYDPAISDSLAAKSLETTPRIRPPKDYSQPIVSFSDSINTDSSIVTQYREFQGLKKMPYISMDTEQYVRKNLDDHFNRTWQDNKKRFELWKGVAGERSGGIADLDFVVPGSKALERFVGGETRINIDGREKITFSGRSEWTEGQIETSVSKNSSFPSLTMKQEPSFRINGDVGRIHIDIKQDPQTGQFSNLEENINIKYQGEDRDIIKYVEAGNTSLTLEGATFAGYRGSHKGLFGIRAEGRMGPLKFTTIASQEKSEANVKTFRGSAEESTTKIRDYEYKSNTYFFLDFVYREQFAKNRSSFDLIRYNPADSIVVFEVYEDDSNIGNNLNEGTFALRGEAYPMDMATGDTSPDYAVEGYYHKLEPMKDYYLDRSLGYIQFMRRVPDESTIGVYIETKSGGSDGKTEYGTLDYNPDDPNTKIELKLIKKKKQLPTDLHTWNLEWKNVYDLGQRPIEPEGLELRIYRQPTDGPPRDTQESPDGLVPYIHVLGLDMKDEMGNLTPDNKIDLNRGFVNFLRGELIFPDLEPFNPRAKLEGAKTSLDEKVDKIYNTQNRQEMEEATRYYIEVKTSSRQATIQVGGGMMGIMEGTDKVLLNGRALSRGNDYRIDYMTGKITLLNEEATSPTADLQILYEEPNAMQEMQKTLVGVRGELDLFANSKIGAVTLFKNESTRDRKVKLGQEPSRMLLFDTDAQFNFESRLLTNIVDKIPLLVASDISTIKLETELARSMPTLNTRGVVYLDDFEGSRNIPIPVVRSRWTMASPPDTVMVESGVPVSVPRKTRGRLQWYNPWNRVKSKDIWPNKETSAGENTVHVLTLGYGKPKEVVNDDEAFAGIMTNFFGAGDDLSRSRFIEVWARGAKGDLNIDIGSISEDYYPLDEPNGFLDTEDKPIPGQGHGDGTLVKEEDTGLDGLFDSQEKAHYLDLADKETDPALKSYYQQRAALADPSGDNFYYKSGEKNNYTGINGIEGNSSDGDRIGMPDSEDINRNGILDTRNNYYEYTISFNDNDDPYLVQDSVPEDDRYGWRLFRIPLWNNIRAKIGGSSSPDSTLIEFARLWVSNTDSTLIQIASIQIVESTWLEQGIEGDYAENDNIRVTNVNTHENAEYEPPPGVKAEIDRETKIRKKEQSLVLEVEELQPGNTALIYRNFERMNLTDYTALKMYVHGPEDGPGGFPNNTDVDSNVEFIMRFGGDKSNYYEYRTHVFEGWDGRNIVEVNFEDCTALKLLPWDSSYIVHPDSIDADTDQWYLEYIANPDSIEQTLTTWYDAYLNHPKYVKPVQKTSGVKTYSLHGRPSVDNVKIITFGVKNNDPIEKLTANIWVNELRMDAERDMTGIAARVNLNTNLGGFVNVQAAMTYKEDDFHDMNAKSGSGQDNTDWNTNVSMNLDRFTPRRWNLRIPISGSVHETKALPRLKSGSDIILDDSHKVDYQSETSDMKYRISYSKSKDQTQTGIKGHVIHWALDKVNASYDYGEKSSSSPFSGMNFSDNHQIKAGYDVDPQEKKIKPFNWLPILPVEMWEKFADLEFAYTPRQLNYDFKYVSRNSYRTNIDNVSDTTTVRTSDDVLNFGYDPFPGVRYTYTRTRTSDLELGSNTEFADLELFKFWDVGRRMGKEVKFSEKNQVSFTAPSLLYIKNSYSYSSNYTESDNPKYSLTSSLGSKSIRLANSFSINGTFSWDKMFEDISGKPKPPKKKFMREKSIEEEWEGDEGEGRPTDQQNQPPAKPPEEAPKGDEKKKGTGLRTKVLIGVSETLGALTFDYSTSRGYNMGGIKDRPHFNLFESSGGIVRFGRGTVIEPDSSSVITRKNAISTTQSFSANTKFNLPLDLGISVRGMYDKSDSKSPSAQTTSINQLPLDTKVNWSRLEEKIPYIDKYITGMSMSSGFSKNMVRDEQNGSLASEKSTMKFSPLFSVSAKLFNRIQTSVSKTRNIQNTDDYSGKTTSFSEKVDNTTSISLKYSLTSTSGLFFFKSVKLSSNIDIGLNMSFQSNESRRGIGEEPMSLVSSNDSWSVSPNSEYRFSRKFRGGMQMTFRNAVDMTKKVRKTREVSIWGEMMF